MDKIRKIIGIFVIALLFAHTNYLLLYYALYKCNTKELTESCCKKVVENCNASCYLSFKMAQQDNSGSNKGESPEIKLKIAEFVFDPPEINPGCENKILYSSFIQNFILDKNIRDVDHPPQS